jgi:hypothetical protein
MNQVALDIPVLARASRLSQTAPAPPGPELNSSCVPLPLPSPQGLLLSMAREQCLQVLDDVKTRIALLQARREGKARGVCSCRQATQPQLQRALPGHQYGAELWLCCALACDKGHV